MKKTPWQRLRYMPATPLYEGQERVTDSAPHRALSRAVAQEGMVLLKNDRSFLPFPSGCRLALFGKAQYDYVKGGGGSGDTTTAYVVSLAEGLSAKEKEGKVSCFAPLSSFYRDYVKAQYAQGKAPGRLEEPALETALIKEARAYTDTAVFVISRYSGEGSDRTAIPGDGDFYLSSGEQTLLDQVLAEFPHVVAVLNIGGVIDTRWFRKNAAVHSVLLAWQAGMEGGNAIADLLCGDAVPSGHLTDTFADEYASYPSAGGFCEVDDHADYEEDIYVGYRYFETIPGAADHVCYPFGFGLSYTDFAIQEGKAGIDENGFFVEAQVTDIGTRPGREVVQLYAAQPAEKLGKPARVLVAWAKTKELAPGETVSVTLRFQPYDMASYDDTGKIEKFAYVLEAGDYSFYLGDNVRDAKPIAWQWNPEKDQVLSRLTARCAPNGLKRRMLRDGTYEELETTEIPERKDKDYPREGLWPREWVEAIPQNRGDKPPQLSDVAEGKITLDEFVDLLNEAELAHLLGGQPNRGVANTFGFGNLPRYGIPNIMTADGPAGLRIRPEAGVTSTACPCATLIACTWDEQAAWEVGHAGAEEVLENGIGVWLTPAINIHRNPLCGRNFEYYSEDPMVAGKMSAAMVRGIQSVKVAASLKHFACNNRENNRRECDSRVSERALREIYLKGFEICVRTAHPWTVMSSYNPVNGVRTSESSDLMTCILRGEWGFDGIVTTDWWTHGEQWLELKAGNDIKMGCGDEEGLLAKVQSGDLSVETLKTSAKRLLMLFLRLQ